MGLRSFLLAGSLLLLALPVAAAEDEATYNCHSWEIVVGDRSEGAGVSTDDGAWYVATQRTDRGLYVVSDGQPVSGEGLLSVWFYEETNGETGLQRADEMCDETDDWQREPDCSILCLF